MCPIKTTPFWSYQNEYPGSIRTWHSENLTRVLQIDRRTKLKTRKLRRRKNAREIASTKTHFRLRKFLLILTFFNFCFKKFPTPVRVQILLFCICGGERAACVRRDRWHKWKTKFFHTRKENERFLGMNFPFFCIHGYGADVIGVDNLEGLARTRRLTGGLLEKLQQHQFTTLGFSRLVFSLRTSTVDCSCATTGIDIQLSLGTCFNSTYILDI